MGLQYGCFCRYLRRSILAFPLAVEMAFRRNGWRGFFLWGGISVLHQRETVQYSWDGAPAIYKGIVESVPEVRGKTLRAEVRVEMQRLSGGKWKRVDRNILLSWMPDSLSSPLACGDSVCFYAKVSRPFLKRADRI